MNNATNNVEVAEPLTVEQLDQLAEEWQAIGREAEELLAEAESALASEVQQ